MGILRLATHRGGTFLRPGSWRTMVPSGRVGCGQRERRRDAGGGSPRRASVLVDTTETPETIDASAPRAVVPGTSSPATMRHEQADDEQGVENRDLDGKFVAYSSNESGRFEVHVQTFPLTDQEWAVSTTGGYEPRWRADGREMYYLSLDQKLMAVAVGPGPSFGEPTALFPVRVAARPQAQT